MQRDRRDTTFTIVSQLDASTKSLQLFNATNELVSLSDVSFCKKKTNLNIKLVLFFAGAVLVAFVVGLALGVVLIVVFQKFKENR